MNRFTSLPTKIYSPFPRKISPTHYSSRHKIHVAGAMLLALLLLLGLPLIAIAHPLGNFTVNRYSRLVLEADQMLLTYVVDMAEIPTQQEKAKLDHNGDGTVDDDEAEQYALAQQTQLTQNLHLTLNGTEQAWLVRGHELSFPTGQAGLPTLRLQLHLAAALPAHSTGAPWTATYQDENFGERLGWQEVVVQAGNQVTLRDSSVSDQDVSQALQHYPSDLLQSPLAINQATFRFTPLAGAQRSQATKGEQQLTTKLSTQPATAGRPVDPFTALINIPTLGLSTILLALLAAFGWGAAHALSPGHGKTVVGAYLVGARGTVYHALFLGVTTTVTHTAGVFVLGFVTLFAAHYILPERLYPWLGVLSGVLVVVIGVVMVRDRWRSGSHHYGHDHGHHHGHAAHDHEHGHQHDHVHALDHTHDHDHAHEHLHSHLPPGADGAPVTWRSLLALGISGGLLPCPSALVVMLGAISLGRVGFGLLLIVAFSLGLASVLTAIGVTLVYAGRLFQRLPESGPLLRLLPIGSALLITAAGIGITLQALVSSGLLSVRL
ncbi:MAG: hypothetical protein R3C14_55265 [Caldilineaceae bacterium]